MVTQNQVSCRQKEYFRRPDEFVPERWLKGTVHYESVSPYLVLPFGHGPRTCIARRLSEQFLQVVLIKVSCIYKPHTNKLVVRIIQTICNTNIPVKNISYLYTLQIVRNFKMTWTGPKLDSKSLLINKPDGPISLKFKTRD